MIFIEDKALSVVVVVRSIKDNSTKNCTKKYATCFMASTNFIERLLFPLNLKMHFQYINLWNNFSIDHYPALKIFVPFVSGIGVVVIRKTVEGTDKVSFHQCIVLSLMGLSFMYRNWSSLSCFWTLWSRKLWHSKTPHVVKTIKYL